MLADSRSPAPARFDLLVFDWDGTLFDSTALIVECIQAAVRDVGGRQPSRPQAAWVIGMGLRQALLHVARDVPPQRQEELIRRYQYHWLKRQHEVTLFEGVEPMLHELRARGHRLAVATGKSRRGLEMALRAAELQQVFDATRTADDAPSKPHPQMLLELMEALQTPPERTLMIGDTTHDMLLARNAGCSAVAVGYGAHAHADLLACQPLALVHSVAELHAWLRTYT